MKTESSNQPELDINKIEPRYGKMKTLVKLGSCASLLTALMLTMAPTQAAVFVQCPGDENGDARWTTNKEKANKAALANPNTKCMHISGSDGFANMGDGYLQYMFGFGDLTGVKPEDAIDVGILNAAISAPTITLDEGDEFYLSLTNTGMVMRPDLFDAHTVHFHGFPNASAIFDGVPDVSVSINMGATLTYYYNIVEPGTYVYHCHVEAAEHMQMGMIGNLYVRPSQNQDGYGGDPDTVSKLGGNEEADAVQGYAYNDGDGSTAYDVEVPLQLTGFDPDFHDASMNTQPLPFADMFDRYHMFNGRGYPGTKSGDYSNHINNPAVVTERTDKYFVNRIEDTPEENDAQYLNGGKNSQPTASRVRVRQGEKLLLRITNLSITKFHTVAALGLPMKVIARGGRELVDKYDTASVNIGGGEAYDVIIDTTGVETGTYHVYVTELDQLSNNQEAFGGPMTEIRVLNP